jgi:tyrosine-protein kinase Etk/Wzc
MAKKVAAVEGKSITRAIRKRWKVVLGAVLVVLIFVIISNISAIPMYNATAKVRYTPQIERGAESIFDRQRTMATEKLVIESTDVLKKAVERTKKYKEKELLDQSLISRKIRSLVNRFIRPTEELVEDPVAAMAGQLGDPKVLAVNSVTKTDMIMVSVTTDDPQEAADLCNAIVEAYVEVNMENKRLQITATGRVLDDELKQVRIELSAAENQLRRFREKHPEVTALGSDEMDRMSALLKDLEKKRSNAELEVKRLTETLGYTEQHPDVVKQRRLLTQLESEYTFIKSKLSTIPRKQLELSRLERVARSKKEIYEKLYRGYMEHKLKLTEITPDVQIIERGAPNPIAVAPKKTLNIVFGLVAGIILGIVLAIAFEFADRSIKSEHDVLYHLDLPVLAELPARDLKNYFEDEINLPKEYRDMRTLIMFSQDIPDARIIGIAGVDSDQDFGPIIASNMALSFSMLEDRNTILIDANFRNPQIHEMIGKDISFGFADYLIGAIDNVKIKTTAHENMAAVTVGQVPSHPSEVMASLRISELFQRLKIHYTFVVLSSSPLGKFPDTAVLGSSLDGLILVINKEKTPIAEAKKAVEKLRQTQSKIFGVLLCNVPK